MVPSGASTGTREAVELRDSGTAFHGKGVSTAVENVRRILGPAIIGMDVYHQEEIDERLIELDGTPNKGRLGANAILGCSLAVSCAASGEEGLPIYARMDLAKPTLPVPFMNVINGGEHAGNMLDIQEHMVAPIGAATYADALRMGSEIYHELKRILKADYGPGAINVGDEGGFAPPLTVPSEPLDLIIRAIEELGYGNEVKLGLDSAATDFFDEVYLLDGKTYSSGELVDFYADLAKTYPLISLEDPFHEDDWDGFRELTARVGEKVQIVGDDIYVTNREYIARGIEELTTNAFLLKVNQIGTLTESIAASKMGSDAGWGVMVSHRSGETEDTFISDLVVALGVGEIKSGAPARGERTAKYNRMLRIEREMNEGSGATYAGGSFPWKGY